MQIRNFTGIFAVVTRHVAVTIVNRRDRVRIGLRLGRRTYWVEK